MYAEPCRSSSGDVRELQLQGGRRGRVVFTSVRGERCKSAVHPRVEKMYGFIFTLAGDATNRERERARGEGCAIEGIMIEFIYRNMPIHEAPAR